MLLGWTALQQMVAMYNYVFFTFANCNQIENRLLLNFLCSMDINGLLPQTVVIPIDSHTTSYLTKHFTEVNVLAPLDEANPELASGELRQKTQATAQYRRFVHYKEQEISRILERRYKGQEGKKLVVLDNDLTMAKNPIQHLDEILNKSNCDIYSCGNNEEYEISAGGQYKYNAGFLVLRSTSAVHSFYRKLVQKLERHEGKEQASMRNITDTLSLENRFQVFEARTYHESFFANKTDMLQWCLLPSTRFPSYKKLFGHLHYSILPHDRSSLKQVIVAHPADHHGTVVKHGENITKKQVALESRRFWYLTKPKCSHYSTQSRIHC